MSLPLSGCICMYVALASDGKNSDNNIAAVSHYPHSASFSVVTLCTIFSNSVTAIEQAGKGNLQLKTCCLQQQLPKRRNEDTRLLKGVS